jgi:hypothetical protein
MSDDLLPALSKLSAAAAGLPEVDVGSSYGTPALKVRKKLLARVKDADTVVLMCPLEEKELLMEAAPELYFETDHYRGWPAVLLRIHAMPAEELALRLRRPGSGRRRSVWFKRAGWLSGTVVAANLGLPLHGP